MDRSLSADDRCESTDISIVDGDQAQLTSDDLLQMFNRKFLGGHMADHLSGSLLPTLGQSATTRREASPQIKKTTKSAGLPPLHHARESPRGRVAAHTHHVHASQPVSQPPSPPTPTTSHRATQSPAAQINVGAPIPPVLQDVDSRLLDLPVPFEILPTDDDALPLDGIRRPDRRFYSPDLVRSDATDLTAVSVHSEFTVGYSVGAEDTIEVGGADGHSFQQLRSNDTNQFVLGSNTINPTHVESSDERL